MRTGPLLALLALAFLFRAPSVRAEDAPKPAEEDKIVTDPNLAEKEYKEIEPEYEAIRGNHDLVPTRRRRELARRLGYLPLEDARKLLNRIVEEDGDLRTQIVAMIGVARVGDLNAVKRMYKHVLKEATRSVLPDYLGPALCHATDPEVGPWIVDKVLKNSNKILKISAVEALGVLGTKEAREPLLALLDKEARKATPNVHLHYEALRALGQIGGEGVKPALLAAAQAPDWRVRLASAEVLLCHFRDETVLETMRKLLKDEMPIVREIAAIAVGRYKIEPLFPELILLMREGNLRAKEKAHDAMVLISSQDYKYAPDAWDKWWSDKKAGKLSEEGAIKQEETISVGTYYDFKIFSDRVLFVVDVSGSMQWPNYEPNRIQVAHRELIKAVRSLNEKTLFNLMTFAGHVNLWQKKGEVPATADNIEAALKWADKTLLPRGGTNTYDALMESLEKNPQVDTVFFLSDGIPSVGKYEQPEEILIKLRYANRFRKVIFNTIALAIGKPAIEKAIKYEDPEEMAAFMKMIAEMNGGTCVDIRKPFRDLRADD